MDRMNQFIQDRMNERMTNIIIGLLGILAVIIAEMNSEKLGDKWATVVISVGTSMIASAIVSYLASIYIFKRKKEKEIVEVWGLESITDNRAQMNEHVMIHLKDSNQHLDIIAYGLKSFRESKHELIQAKINSGLKIRIITVNPECDLLKQKDIDENKIEGSTAKSIEDLCKWAKDFNNQNIEIRFCETLPTELYFRVDDYVYAGPYQIGRESQRSITFEYRNNGRHRALGFYYYNNYFERLWNDPQFCNSNRE